MTFLKTSLIRAMLLFTLMISSSFMIPFSPSATSHTLCYSVLASLISTSNLRSVPLTKPPLNTWVSLLLMAKFAWTLPKSLALACPYHGQRNPGLSRLLQLLPLIYCKLLCHCTPSLRLNLERHCLPMDLCTSSCVCRTYFPVYPSPCPCLA